MEQIVVYVIQHVTFSDSEYSAYVHFVFNESGQAIGSPQADTVALWQ